MSSDPSSTSKETQSADDSAGKPVAKSGQIDGESVAKPESRENQSAYPGNDRLAKEPVDALRRSNKQTNVTSTDTLEQSGTMTNKSDRKNGSKPDEKTSATATPKRSGGVGTAFLVGLVLTVVALGAGLWWQQQRFEAVAKEIAVRLDQSNQLVRQAEQTASQALSIATSQRDTVDQLKRELSVATLELKTLQQAWEAANEGLDQTLLLNDLKRLVTMANQELVLFGNVTSAVSILASVDSMLRTQSAPALKQLQQAILTDLARLRAVPQVDVVSLSARLDSLIQLTGKAPLLSPAGSAVNGTSKAASSASPGGSEAAKSAHTTDSTAAASQQDWWSSWDQATSKVSQWTSDASAILLREFADVMSIRKADDPQALLLSEEQAIQLKANVRAMLLSAQLALMTRQPDIWRSELAEVQSLLNTRYDTQALDTKAALNLLNELLSAPVAAEVPKISDTLSALASAERSLSIPVDTVPSAESPSSDNGANAPAPIGNGSNNGKTTGQGN